MARKKYTEMKEQAMGKGTHVLNENEIQLNPIIKVRFHRLS
jgi:hypothetical protein